MLVVVTLAIGTLDDAAAAQNPFIYIIRHALGGRLGGTWVWMVIGAMWFCGLSSVTSNSRMLFAFLPATKARAALAVAGAGERALPHAGGGDLGLRRHGVRASRSGAGPYSVIVSISTIGFYASYGLPIALALPGRRKQRPPSADRGTSDAGPPTVNAIAVAWIRVHQRALHAAAAQLAHRLHLRRRAAAPGYLLFPPGRGTHFAGPPALKTLARDCYPFANLLEASCDRVHPFDGSSVHGFRGVILALQLRRRDVAHGDRIGVHSTAVGDHHAVRRFDYGGDDRGRA